MNAVAQSSSLSLIENAEHKRRWIGVGRGSFAHEARTFQERCIDSLAECMWGRVEAALRVTGSAASARELLSEFQRGPRERELLEWMSGSEDVQTWVSTRLLDASIPYLAALRHTEAGLETRAQWEHTWSLQRREDAGEKLSSPIPVPPKYDANYYRIRERLGDYYERYVDTAAHGLGLTLDGLRAWRPEAKGRKAREKKKSAG